MYLSHLVSPVQLYLKNLNRTSSTHQDHVTTTSTELFYFGMHLLLVINYIFQFFKRSFFQKVWHSFISRF